MSAGIAIIGVARLRPDGDVRAFDAELFGIAPAERPGVMPASILLLEGVWEALENAGRCAQRRQMRTGLFAVVEGAGPDGDLPWVATKLGLSGPVVRAAPGEGSSIAVVRRAGESLRRGECGLAVVATVGLTQTSQWRADIVVLAPGQEPAALPSTRPRHILCLSARSETALAEARSRLGQYLSTQTGADLADIAYSLQSGREVFVYRQALVCANPQEAVAMLAPDSAARDDWAFAGHSGKPLVYLFPGAGAQYAGMARGLYDSEPAFREPFSECAKILSAQENFALEAAMFPSSAHAPLSDPAAVLAGLFAVEYSLACLWMRWGARPESMIGHSIGEYVAACVSGVLTLKDALRIVAFRGRLFETLPPGAMMSVALGEHDVAEYLDEEVSLAAVNAPQLSVLSGSGERLKELYRRFAARKVEARLLPVTRAGHSSHVTPALEPFLRMMEQVELSPPRIPFLSNHTGDWITPAQATDPRYWAAHLRHTVRFSDGISELLKDPNRVFLEVGPGNSLGSFIRQHAGAQGRTILAGMRLAKDPQEDTEALLRAAARLWMAGADVTLSEQYRGEQRQRVALPAYPFQRKIYAAGPSRAEPRQRALAWEEEPGGGSANEIEATLIRIWQAVLGTSTIRLDATFGQCGGSEAGLAALRQHLEREFGFDCLDGEAGLDVTPRALADRVAERGLRGVSEREILEALSGLDLV